MTFTEEFTTLRAQIILLVSCLAAGGLSKIASGALAPLSLANALCSARSGRPPLRPRRTVEDGGAFFLDPLRALLCRSPIIICFRNNFGENHFLATKLPRRAAGTSLLFQKLQSRLLY